MAIRLVHFKRYMPGRSRCVVKAAANKRNDEIACPWCFRWQRADPSEIRLARYATSSQAGDRDGMLPGEGEVHGFEQELVRVQEELDRLLLRQ